MFPPASRSLPVVHKAVFIEEDKYLLFYENRLILTIATHTSILRVSASVIKDWLAETLQQLAGI